MRVACVITDALGEADSIYPTIKYTAAQLAPSRNDQPDKAKKIVRSTRKPLQIAYAPKPAGYIY